MPDLDTDIETALKAQDDGDPHQLTGFQVMEFVLRRGVRHRIVPRDHWEQEEALTLGTVAELRCQCGALHVIRLAASPQSCTCRRWFFFDGTDVWVLLSPAGVDYGHDAPAESVQRS